MTLEIAQLVRHKGRPDSFGFVDSLEPLTIVWSLSGYKAHRWQSSDPEHGLSPDDLEVVTCPGCGEDQCWCGVGR